MLEHTLGKARPVSQQLDSFAPGSSDQLLLSMWKKILVNHGGRLFFRAFFAAPSCRCGHVLNQMPFGGKISDEPSGTGMGKELSETGRMPKDVAAWALQSSDLPCSKQQYRPCSSKYSSTDLTAALSSNLLLFDTLFFVWFFSIFTLSVC